ncbi:AfsR/SARP family transcriptional regulator [Pseudosporangium ferrugineum]|uniref:AfsR/SARP family transcriptional regulator n=1 Tax=Pseudosporangium ferrugineum TaxID=439699 RepID=UPI001304DB76|nr:AfsR/SARP family transcriptional regulator [Pseudosporangium ferrugineum]
MEIGPRQQRQTLAALLLGSGSFVSVDELIYAVWGDRPSRSAVNSLRIYVHRLRAAFAPFAPSLIRSLGGGYELAGAHHLDLRDLEAGLEAAAAARAAEEHAEAVTHTRSALDLWRGRPLAGLAGVWAQGQRQRIENLRLTAIGDLAAGLLRLGRPESVIALVGTTISEHPFDERVRELLMLAFHQAGRTAEALRVYRETRILFINELGIELGPGLQRLHRQMLDPDAFSPSLIPAFRTT